MIGYNIINANFANIVNEIKNAINNRIIDTMDPKTEKIKVKAIKNIKGNQQKILEFTQKIKVLESEGDKIYRKEVACLFETCNDPIEIIKWKEILEHFEECIDHCEDIADLLRGVVMKYA